MALLFAAARADATTCPNAIPIASLPVSNQTVVCGTSNDITSSNITMSCGSTLYYGGNEALYTFTPVNSGSVEISYNGSPSTTYVGIFVFDGCPTTAGTNCVGNVTSSALTKTLTVTVTAGTTYYLMFDTWPSPQSPCPGTFSIGTCPAPTTLAVSGITTTDATLAWTSTSTDFEIEYGTSATLGSANNFRTGVVSNPYTLTGLMNSTGYNWWVRAICGPGDTSAWSSRGTFTTNCLSLPAPYAEGFNTGSLPSCWSNSNSIGSTTDANLFWKFNNSNGQPDYGPATNGRAAGTYAWLDASSPQTAVVTMTSPVLDLSTLGTPYIQFDWFKNNTDPTAGRANNNLLVEGYDGTAWVQLFNDTSNQNAWRTERITLPASFAGVTDAQFRFSVDKTLSNNFYDEVLVDSFYVMEAPTCLPPTAASVTAVTSSGATLNWTASVSAPNGGYEYEIRSSGAPGSGATGLDESGITAGGATSANATFLTPVTAYTAYVRSVCGAGDSSAWVSAGSFTTACLPYTAPYYENFNSGTQPGCWTNSNSIGSANYYELWQFNATPYYGAANNGRTVGNFAMLQPFYPYTATATLTSPIFDLSGLADPYLKFDWFKNNPSPSMNNNLMVEGYDGTSWVTLMNDTSNFATWRTVGITLPTSFIGVSNAQFRFTVDQSLSMDYEDEVLLDSFAIEDAPSCFAPIMPNVTNLTSNSATLSWTAPATAPAGGYEYEVRTSGAAGSGATGLAGSGNTAAGSTSANLTSLTPVTTYTAYVRSVCGAGDTSAWTPSGSFTTTCVPITTLPWSDGIESVTTTGLNNFPNCWKKVDVTNGTWRSSDAAWTSYNDPRNGSRYLTVQWSATNDVIMTPGFQLTAGTSYDFTFYWAGDTYSGWDGVVGVNTNQDFTGATILGNPFVTQSTTTSNGTYTQETRTFVPTTSGVYYFGIQVNGNGVPYYLGFDDFSLDVTPTCVVPTGVAASAVTANSATLNWTASASAPNGGYEYEVRSSGAAGSGATGLADSGNTTTTSANATGLTPATTYSIYVRAICSAGDTSAFTVASTFTTACATITAPYAQGFNTGSLPNCWTNSNSISSTTANLLWKFNNSNGQPDYGPASNGRAAGTYAWIDASSPQTAVVTLTSPIIDLSSLGTPMVKFDWFKNNTDPTAGRTNNNLMVEGYDGTTWVSLFNDTSNATVWRTESISLPAAFAGVTNAQFRFSVDKTLSNNFYDEVLLDSFEVADVPSCLPPVSPVVSAITTTGATLNWTASTSAPNGGYEYEVRASGAAGSGSTGLAASGNTTTTSANVTGLSAAMSYSVYVRSICGAGDTSAWTPAVAFNTACGLVSVPYMQNFDGVTAPAIPNCTVVEDVNTDSYTWKTYNGNASSTPNALQYSYNSSSAADDWWFTPGINLTSGSAYEITFKYRVQSATYPEKLEVKVGGTATAASMTGTALWSETNATNTTYQTVTVNYTPTTTGPAYFGWHVFSDPDQYNLYIDDVAITAATTTVCAAPTGVTASSITANSAVISWTAPTPAPALGYEYLVRSGSVVVTNTTTATSATVSGLATSSTDTVYVRSICAQGDTSAWSTPYVFQTSGAPCTAPVVNLGNDTAFCAGNYLNLDAGNAGSTYLWSTGATIQSIDVTTSGTYSVAVTNAAGCTGRDTITVTVNPVPVVALGPDVSICSGNSLTLDAGTQGPNATYLWSTGATSQTLSVATAGSYSVTVTNGSGCIGRDTINVTTGTAPVVALGNDTAFCVGGALTLDAGNQATGTTYMWSTGANTQAITVAASGTYSVAVTNAGGCIGRDTINVTVNPRPVVNLGNDTAICAGSSLTLSAGTQGANATYMWSNGATTSSITVSPAASGFYAVNVMDNGCSGFDTIQVTVNPIPVVALGNDTTFCTGSSITLNAGNIGATYLWSTGANTQAVTVSAAGSYSVAVMANGCTGYDTIQVGVTPLPTAGTISVNNQSPTYTFSVTGMQNASSYGWRFGDGAADTARTATHTYTSNGTYTVTFYAVNNCGMDSVSTTITVTTGVANVNLDGQVSLYPNPAADFVTVENTAAQAMKTIRILDVAGALVSEVKATGASTQRLDVSNLASGTYLVRIELEGGAIALRRLQVKH